MSSSPPGPWGAQPGPPGFGPSGPGQQPAGQPYRGSPPPGFQQSWYPPPGPPNKGNSTKWIALAVVAVAAAAAVIVVVLHSNSGGNSTSSATSASASGIASANDNGPVTIITEDPSCAAWAPLIETLASTEQNGWDKRDPSLSASAWTPAQRAQYQAVTAAMLRAADQTVALAKLTPHRVMRELYEQAIAYWRAYADSIANYTPIDDNLARVATTGAATAQAICNAITHGSAAARAPLTTAASPPTQPSASGDPAKPVRFLTNSNPVCGEWKAQGATFNAATAEWQKINADTPASQWSPEEKALNDAFAPEMNSSDDKFVQLGRQSGNPTIEDLAVLNAQYGSAFVQSLPSYVAADQYLYSVTSYSTGVVGAACKAVGS